jgi:predicted PurR-regulated permease PerM
LSERRYVMKEHHLPRRPNRRVDGRFLARATAVLALGAAAIALGALLWYARRVFLLAFAGALFALFLETPASWLSRRLNVRYGAALTIFVLLLCALIGSAVWIAGGRLAEQLSQLSAALPESGQQLRERLEEQGWGPWLEHLPDTSQLLSPGDVIGQVFGATTTALNALLGFFVVLTIGVYGAAQPQWYERGFLLLVPPDSRERARQVVGHVCRTLRLWIMGQVLAMTIVGLLTALGLWLLGAKLPLALGLLAFALEIVPNLGPVISAIPAILLAWMDSPHMALYVLLLYVGIQSAESYALMPLIQARTIHLPPAVHIVSVLLLGLIAGVLGVLVAAPLTISCITLIRELYVEDSPEAHPAQVGD